MKLKNLNLVLIVFLFLSISSLSINAQNIIITDFTVIDGNDVYDTVIIESGGELRIGTGGMQIRNLMHVKAGGKILGGYLRIHKNGFFINDAGIEAINSLDISQYGPVTIGGNYPTRIRKLLVGWRDRPLTLQNSIIITDTCIYAENGGEVRNPIITNGYDVILGANHKFVGAGEGTFINLSGGKIIRCVAPGEEIFIPVGDENGQSNLQLKINDAENDLQDSARIEISMSSGQAHPDAIGLVTTDYLAKYFTFQPVNISGPLFDAGFYYNESDVQGDETLIKSAFHDGNNWAYGDSIDHQNNFIFFESIGSGGDLSAGNLLGENIKPCPAPDNMKVVNVDFTSIELSWTTMEGIVSYTLAWKKTENTGWTEITGLTGDSFLLSGLTDDTEYDIKLKAECTVEHNFTTESGYSSVLQVTTVFDNGCYPPQRLGVSTITDSEATLTWDRVEPDLLSYWVEYRPIESTSWIEVETNPTDTFLLLQGLNDFQEYEFRIKSQCTEGVESLLWSESFHFKTLGSCPEAFNLTAENFAVGAVIFRWEASDDNDEFILKYRLKGDGEWTVIGELTTNVKMVSGLPEGQVYEWMVGAVCDLLRDTVYTMGAEIETLLTCNQVPENLGSLDIGSTSAKITWDAVPGISKYEVKYRDVNDSQWIEKSGSANNSMNLFNLLPNTEYEWSVRTWCEGTDTHSDYSSSISFTTLDQSSGGAGGGLNPIAQYYDSSEGYPAWTNRINWDNIIDMSTYQNGNDDFEKFENARDDLYAAGGGVLYYPAGVYDFTTAPVDGPNGRGLMLKTGVVILGENPTNKTKALEGDLDLSTIFQFKFIEKEPGKEVPADWNFVGIKPHFGEELKDVDNVGIAWVKLVGATVYFGPQMTWGDRYSTAEAWKSSKVQTTWANRKPDGTFPYDPFVGAPVNSTVYEGAGDGRFVFGCQFDDATVINNVINEGFGPDGYYVYKFGSRIGVYGSNVFIANHRITIPTRCFKYTQLTKSGSNTLVFDYADVNSIDVNKTYLNITSNKLSQTGGYWEKGVIIKDNWFYNHGRKGMDVSGYWTIIRNNHNERDYLQEGDDVYGLGGGWELTLDGYNESGGSSDNESRAYDMAGKALWIDGNSWNNTGSNPGNDGESILCQAHGGTQIHSWAVTHNKYAASYNESNKGYLSGYDVSNYGMLVAWNDTKGSVGNLNGKDGDQLIDCAFIASGSYESVVISGDHSILDTITKCPSGSQVPPVNVNAVAVEDSSYIRIQWKDNGDNEIGFRVDRKESGKDE
ncbi:MAG: fibronectin type III domain-containing protein [Bacteroidales bacterium]